LAIVDRAADAAVEAWRRWWWLDLHGEPKIDAVGLRQVLVERFAAAPDIDNLRMVVRQNPINNSKASQPPIGQTGVAIPEQSRVRRLLEIDAVNRRRNDVEMGDVEDRPAKRRQVVSTIVCVGQAASAPANPDEIRAKVKLRLGKCEPASNPDPAGFPCIPLIRR
jgi:hypothetical protein